jgi:hypothetical protein
MLKRLLLSGLAILIAWTVLDVLMHRLLLQPMYEENASLWRPFDQMNVVLIYVVTFTLIATFVGTYWLLIRPKSLGVGLRLGTFIGFGARNLGRFRNLYSHAHPAGPGLGLVHRWMAERHRSRIYRRGAGYRILRTPLQFTRALK